MQSIRQKIKLDEEKRTTPQVNDQQTLIFSAITDFMKPLSTTNTSKPKKYQGFDIGVLTPTKMEQC